ncbi:MAG: NAD(P)-dependent alcohol dehydrogenase [Anaerolineae bacterium]|jgi:NADPH:quinone reductase-like Zn-dependent oxidoreductase|nr:NAD(P)-dependent alcohol dehydrogenase [Anaerolineae bacterium]
MKAIVYTEYGSPDVLRVADVAQPAPKDNEVLIRIHATAVNFGDLIARNFRSVTPRKFSMPLLFWVGARLAFGFTRPNNPVLGNEFAGVVAAVGAQVTRFKPGDAVFGYRGQQMGAYAEYVCMPENGMLALKPAAMTFEEAAAVPYGALTALALLRTVNLQPGQKVLINGASGNIGAAAVQLAKHYGAEVTGVCGTPGLDFVKALGADTVIDYTKEDFTRCGETYDVIFDILGKTSFGRGRKALKPNGRYLFASFKMKQLLQMLGTKIAGGQQVICALSSETPDDLTFIARLIEAGQYKAIVDGCYPMTQAAKAHHYVEQGHKRGSVVITIWNPNTPQGSQTMAAQAQTTPALGIMRTILKTDA